MGSFHFRLQRVLRVREVQEELALLRWREAAAAAQAADEAALRMRRARTHAAERLGRDLHSGQISAPAMIPAHAALDDMDRAAGRLERRARILERQAEELRRPFEERRREVRGLERLRERRLSDWRREDLRKEIASMDEIASMRSKRPRSAEQA